MFLLEKPETVVAQHAQSQTIHFRCDMKGLCISASLPGAAPLGQFLPVFGRAMLAVLRLQPAAFHEAFLMTIEVTVFLQKHFSVVHCVSDAITPVYAAMLWQRHKSWVTTAYNQLSS